MILVVLVVGYTPRPCKVLRKLGHNTKMCYMILNMIPDKRFQKPSKTPYSKLLLYHQIRDSKKSSETYKVCAERFLIYTKYARKAKEVAGIFSANNQRKLYIFRHILSFK